MKSIWSIVIRNANRRNYLKTKASGLAMLQDVLLTRNKVRKLLRSPKNSSMLTVLESKIKYSPRFSQSLTMLLCMVDSLSYCSLAIFAKLQVSVKEYDPIVPQRQSLFVKIELYHHFYKYLCIRFLGLHDKIPQTWSRKLQKFVFSHLWRLEVQYQGVGEFDFFWALFLGLLQMVIFLLCPHTVVLLHCLCPNLLL